MNEDLNPELISSINDSFKSLVADVPVSKLPEDIFKNYFLPYFTGEKTPSRAEPVFARWVGIAGNPVAPVDIIDKNEEVLFRVPPLYDTGLMSDLQGKTMREIFAQYNLYNNNLPQVANNFLTKALTAKSENYDSVSLKDAEVQWKAILKRYDKYKDDKIADKNQDGDDDLIYD